MNAQVALSHHGFPVLCASSVVVNKPNGGACG